MKRALLFCVLTTALLAGCGPTWTHPYIAGPRDEDKRFETDSAQCRVQGGDSEQMYEDCLRHRGWEKKD